MSNDEDEPPMIVCCQGPPACILEGDEAGAAQQAGCIWCKRMTLLPNGEWHTSEPPAA